jgi:hypothetical protein
MYPVLCSVLFKFIFIQKQKKKTSGVCGGSHGSEDDDVILGCDAMQTRRMIPVFQRNILPPSSDQKNNIVTFNVP